MYTKPLPPTTATAGCPHTVAPQKSRAFILMRVCCSQSACGPSMHHQYTPQQYTQSHSLTVVSWVRPHKLPLRTLSSHSSSSPHAASSCCARSFLPSLLALRSAASSFSAALSRTCTGDMMPTHKTGDGAHRRTHAPRSQQQGHPTSCALMYY